MKSFLKNLAFSIGGISPVKEICKVNKGRAGIICYHRVIPDSQFESLEGPHKYLSIKESLFEEHIALLVKKETLVSMDEIHEHLLGKSNTFVVALTFDDGYKDNLNHALPILEKYDAPVTIYVTTSFLEGDTWAWWFEIWDHIEKNDHIKLNFNNIRLEWDTSTNKLKNKCYKYFNSLLIGLKKQEQEIILESLIQTSERKKNNDLFLNWKELTILEKHPLVTIGAHTHSHANLRILKESEVFFEMNHSNRLLEKNLKKKIDHFAYPYGTLNEATTREYELAKKNGYKTAVTTVPKSCKNPNMHAIPRYGIPNNLNAYGLQGKLSGWEQFLRHILI